MLRFDWCCHTSLVCGCDQTLFTASAAQLIKKGSAAPVLEETVIARVLTLGTAVFQVLAMQSVMRYTRMWCAVVQQRIFSDDYRLTGL